MQEGSLSEDLWSAHRQDHRPKRHRHSWKGEMKASNLEKVWREQTHDLIVMNLHSQLMETGNDIDLKYVDIMILLCTRGFQPADVCITCSRASDYSRDTCQGSISWSKLELRSAQCVSVAVLLANQSCQTSSHQRHSSIWLLWVPQHGTNWVPLSQAGFTCFF